MNLVPKFLRNYIAKQLTEVQYGSPVYQKLLQALGYKQPIWIGQDLDSIINKAYGSNALVYSIIDLIAKKAAAVPWVLYEIKDDKALRRYKSAGLDNLHMKEQYLKKALEEIRDHKILDIWNRPNPLQGGFEWRSQTIAYRLATGNAYTYGAGPDTGENKGQYHELYNLPSQIVTIKAGTMFEPIESYTIATNQDLRIEPQRVMHRKYYSLQWAGGAWMYGLSPLAASSKVVTRSLDTYTASVAMLQNSGPKGFISGAGSGPELTEQQAQDIESRMAKKYGGPKNLGKYLVTNAALTWNQIGLSPVDLAIIEAEKMDLRALCNVYHVASQLFNDPENKSYNNEKEANRALYKNAAIPELDDLRDEANRWWIPAFQGDGSVRLYLDYDLSAIADLQENMKELTDWLERSWWLTPNQKLEIQGFEESEDEAMSKVWIPQGLLPIDAMIEPGEDLNKGIPSDYQ